MHPSFMSLGIYAALARAQHATATNGIGPVESVKHPATPRPESERAEITRRTDDGDALAPGNTSALASETGRVAEV